MEEVRVLCFVDDIHGPQVKVLYAKHKNVLVNRFSGHAPYERNTSYVLTLSCLQLLQVLATAFLECDVFQG